MSELVQDDSIESAAAVMPDIEALERAMGIEKPRDEAGKFARTTPDSPKAETTEPAAKPQPEATATKTEAPAAEQSEEDEIELPPEKEGDAPTRLKLNDVLAKYTKAEALEAELAKLKADPKLLPVEVDRYVTEAVTEAQRHTEQIDKWQALNKPTPPDDTLLDPHNPNADPALYWAQKQRFDALTHAHAVAEQEKAQITQRVTQQQEAIRATQYAREQAALFKALPKLADKAAATQWKADVQKHFGFDDALINSVIDHRFYILADKALQTIAREAQEAQAAKVVKAKPKVISGSARSSQSPAQRRSSDAFGRLQSDPNNMDAAVAALEGLF